MDDELKFSLRMAFIIIFGIVAIIGVSLAGTKVIRDMKYQNFQETIKDLSDEQKCIHICGFEWHGYFESYKFCMEKCDRISEREANTEQCS